MTLIGVVADDLTGATTTGVLLARSKAKTAVYFNVEAALNAQDKTLDSVLISTNSRAIPKKEAYEKVSLATKALKNMGIKYFSKRIDTTLRGGIGTEIDAMLDNLDSNTLAIVVPSMPQSRRILVGGYSIIDGVALINTPVAKDVRTPVLENHIPTLLNSQTVRKIDLIELNTVLNGKVAIKNEILNKKNNGAKIIVIDAITIEDVDEIAKACIELDCNILAVDPGPFTSKLALNNGIIQKEEQNIPKNTADGKGKTVLIAAGSATPVTKTQMENLLKDERHKRISVDAIPFIDGGDTAQVEINRAVNIAIDLIKTSSPRAILIESGIHGQLLNLQKEDKKRNYACGMSANRINSCLGVIIANILEEIGRERIAGIYTTGGDTMVNVCFHLGVECIQLVDYVIAQTDVGRLTGKYEGLPIVGKGGLTGNDNIAFDIIDRLFKEATR